MSLPDPSMHPERAALLAHLFGQTPPELKFARYLDCEAGAGERLFPLADRWPAALFVGISPDHEALNAKARRSGLKRLRFVGDFEAADVALAALSETSAPAAFDVIFCAGGLNASRLGLEGQALRAARTKLLVQMGMRLKARGLVLLQLSSAVGGALLGAVPEMLQLFDDRSPEADRARLQFFARFMPQDDPLSALWAAEAKALSERAAEDRAVHAGEPLSLVQLCDLLPKAGLRFVGQPDWRAMVGGDDPETALALSRLAQDEPRREALQAWRHREESTFVVLSRCDQPVDRALSMQRFAALYVQPLKLRAYRSQSGFGVLGGGQFWSDPDLDLRDALVQIAGTKGGISVGRLFSDLGRAPLQRRLCSILLQWQMRQLCVLSLTKPQVPNLTQGPGVRYFASPFMRESGERAFNAHFETFTLDRLDRALLQVCDGRTLEALTDALMPQVAAGELRIIADGAPTTDPKALSMLLQKRLDRFVKASLCTLWPPREPE